MSSTMLLDTHAKIYKRRDVRVMHELKKWTVSDGLIDMCSEGCGSSR